MYAHTIDNAPKHNCENIKNNPKNYAKKTIFNKLLSGLSAFKKNKTQKEGN